MHAVVLQLVTKPLIVFLQRYETINFLRLIMHVHYDAL